MKYTAKYTKYYKIPKNEKGIRKRMPFSNIIH